MSLLTDADFIGSLPKVYGEYLVPIFFEPYANDISNRLRTKKISTLLETAAGTGVVTRSIDSVLAPDAQIIATDLNQPMIDQASKSKFKHNVKWQQVNAQNLPFDDNSFDAVICQFGVMFFPDRAKAYAETYRVLKPGGVFIFNVWDDIRHNDFANTVNQAMESVFPDDPPRFLPRTPYAYYNEKEIMKDLLMGGFKSTPKIETKTYHTKAASPEIPAMAIIYGTPLKNDIEERNSSLFEKCIDAATKEITKKFGERNVEGKLQAKVIEIVKD